MLSSWSEKTVARLEKLASAFAGFSPGELKEHIDDLFNNNMVQFHIWHFKIMVP